MKGLSKVLSIVLILGAVLGFYGGAVNIKDVLACQDYWEEQGEITDENLGKLEDGIAQLEENEEAYVQGVADYEKGQADLAAGKQELAEGKATLTAKTKELNDGKATLAAKTKELNDGKATLAASAQTIANGEKQLKALEPLEQGMAAFQSQLSTLGYSTAYQSALTESKSLLSQINTYGQTVKQTGEGIKSQAEQIADETTKEATKKAGQALVDAGDGLIANVNAFSTNAQLVAGPVGGFASRYTAASTDPAGAGIKAILDQIIVGCGDNQNLATLKNGATNLETSCGTWLTQNYAPINPAPTGDSQTDKYATLRTSAATLVSNILTYGLITDEAQKTVLTKYTTADNINAPDIVVTLSGVFTKVQQGIDAKKQELANGKAQYAAGEKQIADGEVQLAAGEKKIADGEKQLAEGKVTLANGEATVADGEKQLAEGEAKLAEYEDGEAQLMAGLDTLLASETYSGLKSIKARLGKNFSYMQDNNKNLDLEKASLAVQTGRDFSADSSVKITKEIKTRAIGQGVGLFGAVLALVAGIVGLSKKNKTAGILALLAAVSAIAGIVVFNGAGFEMSEIAGSTLTGMSAIYAMVVVAVAGVLGGIAHLSIKKDAE